MQARAAQAGPASPACCRNQKNNVANGGWTDTWVVHASGTPTMRPVKSCRNTHGSPMAGRSCRYSWGESSLVAQSPSTEASEKIQAKPNSQPQARSVLHRSVPATRCSRTPASTRATAGSVQTEACGAHSAKIGGNGNTRIAPCASSCRPTTWARSTSARAAPSSARSPRERRSPVSNPLSTGALTRAAVVLTSRRYGAAGTARRPAARPKDFRKVPKTPERLR